MKIIMCLITWRHTNNNIMSITQDTQYVIRTTERTEDTWYISVFERLF